MGHTTTNLLALVVAAKFVGFSYTNARFQYAPARQLKAQTRVRKIVKKTMFVRREQIRKTKQTSPIHINQPLPPLVFIAVSLARSGDTHP